MVLYEEKLNVSQVGITNTSGTAYVQGQLVMEQGFFGNVVDPAGIANGSTGTIDCNSERIIETSQTKAADTFAVSVNGNPSSVYFDRTNAYLTDTDAAGLVEVGFIVPGGAADANDVIRFKPLPQVPLEGSVPPGSIDTADIADDAVTNAKLNNIAQGFVKVGGAADAPTDLDASGDGKILVGDGTDLNSVAVSGDVTLSNAGAVAIAANKVTPLQAKVETANVSLPVAITYDVTTGSASEKIFTADAPFKFEILDVVIQPRGASTNGTMKITNGTNDITNAMVCAVDKTIVRPATIDNAYSVIDVNETLEIVCAGDAIGSTIGLVTILVKKVS